MTTQKRTRRPAGIPPYQPAFKGNAIHALLTSNLPSPYVRSEPRGNQSILDTQRLAVDLGVNRYTVYRFLNDEKLSKKSAAGLVRISGGAISENDLLPFLMRL